ncbi:3-hydroxyacyl-CoA dehydrogenase [Phakopsora pachyrhizi]|nr:3-hydroxyacyl-CoA dehydrogenase [Phakopsora pachyrhizi]
MINSRRSSFLSRSFLIRAGGLRLSQGLSDAARSSLFRNGPSGRNYSVTTSRSDEVKSSGDVRNVTIIGAGLMGSGIAQVMAQAGLSVTLKGLNDSNADQARSTILKSLGRISKKKFPDDGQVKDRQALVDSVISRIKFSNSIRAIADGENRPDLIVEAIVENLEIKRELFTRLDQNVRSEDCIFASNTSSLRISDISSVLPQNRQRNFAGLHFFNPVPQMKLVEIVKASETSPEVIDRLASLSKFIGKTPVRCKDTPGFIVNRLLVPFLLESMRMLERGEATKEDIDTAMKLGAGHPMGPIELSDYVGLDTMKFISDGWRNERGGEIEEGLVKPVEALDRLVSHSKLGTKTKEGFYKY